MGSLRTLLDPIKSTSEKRLSVSGLQFHSNMYTWAEVSMINLFSISSVGLSYKVALKSRVKAMYSKLSIAFKHRSTEFSGLDVLNSVEFHDNVTSLMNEENYWGCFYIFPNLYEERYSPVVQVRRMDDVRGLISGMLTVDMVSIHLNHLRRTPILGDFVLIKLDLSSKHLTNIDVLRHFKYITYLNLESNYLHNLKVLSYLLYLQYLSVDYNRLETILDYDTPQWFLSEVHYKYNSVQAINDLDAFWSLTVLVLSHNNIKCITGLKNLRYLRHLDLSFNHIQRLENLDYLQLTWLDVSYNNISTFSFGPKSGLWTLLHLAYLNLNENNFTSMKLLSGCTRLQELHARNNRFNTLMELEVFTRALRGLMILDLRANPICFKSGYKHVIFTTFPMLLQLDDVEVDPVEQRNAMMDMEPNCMTLATRRLLRLMYVEQLSRSRVSAYTPPADTTQVPLVLLVGCEAVGKGQLARRLSEECKEIVTQAILHTTAIHHYQDHHIEVTQQQFDQMLLDGEFLTYTEMNGNSYGLSRKEAYILDGKVKIACLDLTSALMLQLRGRRPYVILVTSDNTMQVFKEQNERKFARLEQPDYSHRSTLQVLLSGNIIIRGILNEIIMNVTENNTFSAYTSENDAISDFTLGSECSYAVDNESRPTNTKSSKRDQVPMKTEKTPATSVTRFIHKMPPTNDTTSMHSLFKANLQDDYASVIERSGDHKYRGKKISDSSRQNFSKSLTWKGSEGVKSSKSVTFTSTNTIHKPEVDPMSSVRSNMSGDIADDGTTAGYPVETAGKISDGPMDSIYRSISCKVPCLGRHSSENSMDTDLWLSFLIENGLLDASNTTNETQSCNMQPDKGTNDYTMEMYSLLNDFSQLPSESRKWSVRNNLPSLHRHNPGLFWDTINSSDRDFAYRKLKKIVMDIVKSQHQFKPMFDIDVANMDCYPTVQKKLQNIQMQIAPHRLFH